MLVNFMKLMKPQVQLILILTATEATTPTTTTYTYTATFHSTTTDTCPDQCAVTYIDNATPLTTVFLLVLFGIFIVFCWARILDHLRLNTSPNKREGSA